jgi:uncharacterized membrane protein
MKKDVHELSRHLMNKDYDSLSSQQQHVIHHISVREPITKDVLKEHEEQYTFGQRAADRVASFGGSWPFIGIFFAVMAVWIVLNSYILIGWDKKNIFDPYPYILLNLVLSMMAGIQAPIIMMSQNRQAQKDRLDATHDYEVNLKAELEIMALHQKLDALREHQWEELVTMQKEQIEMLASLVEDLKARKQVSSKN